MKNVLILGCFLLGLILRYSVKRRKFKRRNALGREIFASYERAWITRWIEGLLFWGGTLLCVYSVWLFLFHH